MLDDEVVSIEVTDARWAFGIVHGVRQVPQQSASTVISLRTLFSSAEVYRHAGFTTPTVSGCGCSTPGCSSRATWRGKCAACNRIHERRRGTRSERGYDGDWQRLRAAHLARHPWCACQHGVGRSITDGCGMRATDVDHIESIKDAPHRRLDPTNLRSFAHACHSRRTAREQSGWGRGDRNL